MDDLINFKQFSKIPRLSRDIIITEKIDGTNGQIYILDSLDFFQYINNNDPEAIYDGDRADKEQWVSEFIEKYCIYQEQTDINDLTYIFAGSRKRWLNETSDNYGFAKWVKENGKELLRLGKGRHFGEWYGQGIQRKYGLEEKRFALFNVKKWSDDNIRPPCCGVVPILFTGDFTTDNIEKVMTELTTRGSFVVPGFTDPEGVVIYHKASGQLFKKTTKNDEKPKGLSC